MSEGTNSKIGGIFQEHPYQGAENFEKDILDPILKDVVPYSEMTLTEKYFLNGMIRHIKPKKVLEVGVSAGGGTAIILNAIKDMPESRLVSVDRLPYYYRDSSRKAGFVAGELFPEQSKKQWELFAGKDVSWFIKDIGSEIDLLVLDTAHVHPWETFNFLTILPFLGPNAWVVLHDISLYLSTGGSAFACKYLFDYVTSENKIRPVPDTGSETFSVPNIGAFQITEDTYKYIADVFMNLMLPWDSTDLLPDELNMILNTIKEYYTDDLASIFSDSIIAQKVYNMNRRKIGITDKMKMIVRIINPGLFDVLKRASRNIAK